MQGKRLRGIYSVKLSKCSKFNYARILKIAELNKYKLN